MKTSEATVDLYKALVAAQGELKVATKGAQNSFTNKNYADFQNIVEACRPALTKNNLGFSQMCVDKDGVTLLITRIFHVSGQWMEGEVRIKTQKEDPQSFGASLSYFKRYCLQAALGIAAANEDDDAETAMKRDDPARPASKADISNLVKAFQGIGVTQHQMLTYIGVKDPLAISEGDLELLKSIGAEIKSGKAKKDAYFQ